AAMRIACLGNLGMGISAGSLVMEAGGIVLTLVAFCAIVAFAAWLAWWMLEPINRVAGVLRATTRFMLTDVIGLMIMLQVGLAIIGRALSGSEVRGEEAALYWVL